MKYKLLFYFKHKKNSSFSYLVKFRIIMIVLIIR